MAEASKKTRSDAWEVFSELTKTDSLVKHGLTVEAVMRAYALKFKQDRDLWGMTGLLHDFDYEQYPAPEEHATVGGRILTERSFPEEVVHAVMAHNAATGVPRSTLLDKALFSVDELTGLVTATALVKPNKSIWEVDADSVIKKMKDKAFARSVSREDIRVGIEDMDLDMKEHIAFVIDAMKEAAPVLGLQGVNPYRDR